MCVYDSAVGIIFMLDTLATLCLYNLAFVCGMGISSGQSVLQHNFHLSEKMSSYPGLR